jgi:putative ABC transport system permease protein
MRNPLADLHLDLRLAVRGLLRSPAYTAAAVAVLALGLGLNVALWSLVQAVLLRPLPIPDPESAVLLSSTVQRDTLERRTASYPDFLDWRAEMAAARVFDRMAVFNATWFVIGGRSGADGPERIDAVVASADYLPLLGATPLHGRLFGAEEDRQRTPAVVLSHRLWRERFDGDPAAVGRAVRLSGRLHTVIGVLGPGFRDLQPDADLWVPLTSVPAYAENLESRGARWLQVLARRAAGVPPAAAQAAMDTLARRLAAAHPRENEGYGALVLPLAEELTGDLRPSLLLLLGAVAFVLLLASANLANLTLARALGRSRQTAVHAALGAGPGRLVRQPLAEGLLLAAAGGLLGLLVAQWALDLLLRATPVALPGLVQVTLDGPVFAFAAGLAALTGLLVAALPALHTARVDLHALLKDGGRAGAGRERGRLRNLLIVGEVAVATALVLLAGLVVQSFRQVQAVDPGFRAAGLLSARVSLPRASYGESAGHDGGRAFAERLRERLAILPGVTAVALASDIPLGDDSSATRVTPEGWDDAQRPAGEKGIRAYVHNVSPGFFDAAGIPLQAGRDFTRQDQPDGPLAVVVSRAFAERVWPGTAAREAVGRRLKRGRPDSENPWCTVVGVVADARHRALLPDPEESPDDPDLYFPLAQEPELEMAVLLRVAGQDPAVVAGLAGPLREAVRGLDRDVPVHAVRPMTELVADRTALPRFSAALMSLFGLLALLLAAVGIYAVLSHAVADRFHEIGVRLALGAERRDVAGLVAGKGLTLALAGVGLGLAAAFALSGLLANLLYEVDAADPATFAAAGLLLLGVAGAAATLPALRATRVDPVVTLKAD